MIANNAISRCPHPLAIILILSALIVSACGAPQLIVTQEAQVAKQVFGPGAEPTPVEPTEQPSAQPQPQPPVDLSTVIYALPDLVSETDGAAPGPVYVVRPAAQIQPEPGLFLGYDLSDVDFGLL